MKEEIELLAKGRVCHILNDLYLEEMENKGEGSSILCRWIEGCDIDQVEDIIYIGEDDGTYMSLMINYSKKKVNNIYIV